MQLSFYGGAGEVTGSCTLIETSQHKILVDCGLFQGSEKNEKKNEQALPFDPKEIDAVFITHAHLDHVGRLPLLTKGGFEASVYATPPTTELLELVLKDALHVMQSDHEREGRTLIYEEPDVEAIIGRLRPADYGQEYKIGGGADKGGVTVVFHEMGHIFGSAFIEIRADGKKVVFSGDVGSVNVPILRDSDALVPDVDALICESTYGDRIHEELNDRAESIRREVVAGIKRGGTVMIPSFALERTQELVYELNHLIDKSKILGKVPIFLDSPLAIDATKVYRKYPKYYDKEAEHYFEMDDDLFNFPNLTVTYTRDESMKINHTPSPKVVIAGAGMMNGGRIVHHALRYLSDERSTLLFIGYQAEGTLGRQIQEGKRSVQVLKEKVKVRCAIKTISSLSAHGDQKKLMDWIGGGRIVPKKVYLNHGDPKSSKALAKRLIKELHIKTTVVNFGLSIQV